MSRNTLFNEDLELDRIRETEQQLLQREKEFAETRKRIALERSERESMMPPFEEIQARLLRKRHEHQVASRGEVNNILRVQNRSILLLVLLVTATGTLIWWGMKLMQGG